MVAYVLGHTRTYSDNNACVDPEVLHELQGDYYPHITFWKCGPNGELEPVEKKLPKLAIGSGGKKA